MDKIRRKGTPIGQYGSDLDFGVPPQSFGRALMELSILKFVTWILPQLTARGFVSNQSEAGLAGL
jgi:hypothetical protein